MSKCSLPSLFTNEELNPTVNENPELTVLSFGGGQDSTTILYKMIYDIEFRKKYAPNKLLVLMSDTGDEHDETYEHIKYIKSLCSKHEIEFVLITNDMGFHGNGWGSLTEQYALHNTIGSKAYPKTCTARLKLNPLYNFLEKYIAKKYNLASNRKVGYNQYAKQYGKLHVLIGIAKGEENRIAFDEESNNPQFNEAWKNNSLHIRYPLVDLQMDRQACQDYIKEINEPLPLPSNCMRCPWLSLQELLWLYRFRPLKFEEWVILEKNKLNAHMHVGDKNLGVWGKFNKKENRPYTLLDALDEAIKQFGDWSDEKLQEYKMSHGHCVASKY